MTATAGTSTMAALQPTGEWQRLVATAVLGSDRAGSISSLVSGPPRALLDQLAQPEPGSPQPEASQNSPVARFLQTVGILSIYESAGRLPSRTGEPAPQPCPADDTPECSFASCQHLSRILDGDYGLLLDEWCHAAHRAGVRAAEEQLPALLDRCSSGQLRASQMATILAVSGARGRWLAQQNEDWRKIMSGGAEPREAWRTGEKNQRRQVLQSLRSSDPDAARVMVTETWEQENPDDREWIVTALADRLSLADEGFLEAALDDKRKPVRTAAADLLARLPESAFCQRMTERAAACLKLVQRKKLLGGRRLEIEATLPEGVDKAMTRDGIENKARDGMGNKAAVLCQLLAATPLVVWEKAAGCPAEEIVAAAHATEWKGPLLRGWIQAAARQGAASWAPALLENYAAAQEKLDSDDVSALLRTLDHRQREQLVVKMLRPGVTKLGSRVFRALLEGCEHDWSEVFSIEVLTALQRYFGTSTTVYDYELRTVVTQTYARFMSPALAEAAATGWKNKENDAWMKGEADMVDRLSATLAFRRAMIKELSP